MSDADRPLSPPARPNGPRTALYLGFFATAWFSWAGSSAPEALGWWLRIGAYAAVAVAVAGAVSAVARRSASRAPRNRSADRKFVIIVLIEFAVAFIGASLLNRSDYAAYTPAFVGAVVGLHFLPLAGLLHDRALIGLGIATTAIAVVAAVTEAATATAAGTVAGTGIGALLLAYAVFRLAGSWTTQPSDRPADRATP